MIHHCQLISHKLCVYVYIQYYSVNSAITRNIPVIFQHITEIYFIIIFTKLIHEMYLRVKSKFRNLLRHCFSKHILNSKMTCLESILL